MDMITITVSAADIWGECERSSERCERALNTAIESIKSVLEDEEIDVYRKRLCVYIDYTASEISFSLPEIKEKIKGSFTDRCGDLYPEFGTLKIRSIRK